MSKLMKRLLVVAVFVLAIVGMTVLCASAAETTGYADDDAAIAADSSFVARVGAEGTSATYYTSIQDACAAATNKSTIYIIQNFEATEENDSTSKTLTIEGVDLGDGTYPTITHTGGDLFNIQNGSNITVKKLNIDTIGYLVYLTGNLTFGEGVNITGTITASQGLISYNSSGTRTITFGSGCNVTLTNTLTKTLITPPANTNFIIDGATMNITGGGKKFIDNYGNLYVNGTLTFTNCNDGIKNFANATMWIAGGSITSNGYVFNNCGNGYVTGGTLSGTYWYNAGHKTYVVGANTVCNAANTSAGATATNAIYYDDAAAAANGRPVRFDTTATEVTLPDDSVANVRLVGAYYTSLNTATAALTVADQTVYVIGSYKETVGVTSSATQSFTLTALYDAELTIGCSNLFDLGENSTVVPTIKNIKIYVPSGVNLGYFNGVSVIIDEGAYIYGQGTSASNGLIRGHANATITVKSGATVVAQNTNFPLFAVKAGSFLDIQGGTFIHEGTTTTEYAMLRYYDRTTKVKVSGDATFIMETTGAQGYMFYRHLGALVIDGEDVKLISRTDNGYLFKNGYHDSISGFNSGGVLDVTGAYLHGNRTDGAIVHNEGALGYVNLNNVTLDSDAVAGTINFSGAYYFLARIDVGNSAREITIPATTNTEAVTKTVYGGYYSTYATAIAAAPTDGTAATVYFTRNKVDRIANTPIAAGQSIILSSTIGTITINGSNASWFLSGAAGSTLTLSGITINGCPTKFITTSGDFAMTNGATMTLEANDSTSETTPIIELVDAATFTMAAGTTLETVYPNGERVEGEPSYIKNPHVVNMTSSFTGTVDIAGTITHNWDTTGDWGPIFRVRGNATIILRSTAVLTLNTTAAAAGGQAMFLNGDAAASNLGTVTVEAGAQLTSTTYPLFYGNINFDTLQSAINAGMVARFGDSLKAANYYKTLLGAISAISADDTVVTLIADTSTTTIYSPKSGSYKAGVNGTAYSFVLTSINEAVLTTSSSWLFDLGNGATVIPTLRDITINLGSKNLGYLNNVKIVIDDGAYIYGTGSSATNGLIYCLNNTTVTVNKGAKLEVTSGANPMFALEGKSAVNATGATLIYSGTGYMFYGNGTGASTISDAQITLTTGGLVNVASGKTNAFTFNNGKVTSTLTAATPDFVNLVAGSSVTFNASWLVIEATYTASNNPLLTNAGTLTFNNPLVQVTTNGMDFIHNTGTFVVKGNTVLTLTGGGDGIENKGTFIMTDGSINTGTSLALYNNASTAYITGGTINGGYASNGASTFTYIVGDTASFAKATGTTVYFDTAAAAAHGFVAYTAAAIDAGFAAVEFPALAGGETHNVRNDYVTSLDAAAAAVTAEKSVMVLIADFTQAGASMTDPAASFTLTSIDKDNITLNVTYSWLFDYGNNTGKSTTLTNVTINLNGNNLGYFRDPVYIGEGAYIYGTGKSAGEGMIYGLNAYAIFTVSDGAKIETTGGSYPMFALSGGATLNVTGGELVYNGTSYMVLASAATVNISGGELIHRSSSTMLDITNTVLNISGGTLVNYGKSAMVYYKTDSKITVSGTATMIHEGGGTNDIFLRSGGGIIIDGADVKLIARGDNYIFENGYQTNVAGFNDTTKLIIRGAYLSTGRADGIIIRDDVSISYVDFTNITLDGDAVASTLHGDEDLGGTDLHYYFKVRIDNGDSAREITIPATDSTAAITKTVYGGYYMTFAAAWAAAESADFTIYFTGDQTGIARATYTINGNVTFNLNGHTVAAAEANDGLFTISAGATLTLLNGTFTASNRFAWVYGTLNLGDAAGETGALIITDPDKITGYMFEVIGAAQMNVYKNATLKTTTTASIGANNYIQLVSSFSGAVNVYGTIELNHAVTGNYKMFRATSAAGGAVNVYDGAVLTYNCVPSAASNEHAMFYNYDSADFTYNIEGGTLKNTAGMGVLFFVYKGTVNISGGSLESNGAYGMYAYGTTALNISGGTLTSKGASTINVYVVKDSTVVLSITGGTFVADSTVNAYNVYLYNKTEYTITDATFIHNGTGQCLNITNSTNNVYIKGNTTITHNGTASTSNIALSRGGGKYVYVDGADANLTISAPNGAYLLRTAYYVTLSNLTLDGSCATLGSVSGEDKYMLYNNVIVPAGKLADWGVMVGVSDGTTTWAYGQSNTSTMNATYFGYAIAKLAGMDATDVSLTFGKSIKVERQSGGYTLPEGKNITMSGPNMSITINGSNGQPFINVPETTALTINNVTFTDCPCNFAKVYGTLNLGTGANIIIYTTTANDAALGNKHEVSPVIELYYDAVVTMADGATIQLLYMDTDETPTEAADYGADFHIFMLDTSFYGALTISGDITYNWNTTGISAFVYAESTAGGSLTITDTATFSYTGTSTNGTAATNGYLVLYGSPNVSVAQSVLESTTTYDNYPFCVGLELGLDNGVYVPVTPDSGYVIKLASPTGVAYYKTIAEAHAAITAASTQYAIFVLEDYTFTTDDRKTFNGKYYLTVSGITPDITITESVSGWMWAIKAGAQLTLRNIKIVTNGQVVQVDAGGTNTYLTFDDGCKIIGQGAFSTGVVDLWNAANFTMKYGSEIDTTGTTATSQIQLIHAQNSCQKPINIAGKITHGTAGNYNHKILRTSSSPNQSATLTINILETAELIYNCPDAVGRPEAAIIHNYPGDLYNVNFVINVYEGAKLQHNTLGSIFYFAAYGGTQEVNVLGGTFEITGGASFAHLTCGSTMNLQGGTIKITNGAYVFGGDQSGTYTVSGNVVMELANVTIFRTNSKLHAEEVHFVGCAPVITVGEGVVAVADGADTRYVKHNASLFASDEIAALFLASYRANGAYYSALADAINATTDESNTVYVLRDDVDGKRVSGGIAITGKTVVIDGQGHTMSVNGANDQFLFVIAADGTLVLRDLTITYCPTKLASLAGALELQNADLVLYTKIDNEEIINETSPLVYLTGAGALTMDAASTVNYTYMDGDDREFVDNQANIYVFHTAADWNGTMDISGSVTMGWNVEGRSPIFFLESTAGTVTIAATAVIAQTGTASAANNALVIATVGGTTEFYIVEGATLSTVSGIVRLGDVTPLTAYAARVLGYGDFEIVQIIITWGAMTFDYTHPDWNTDTMRWENNVFTPTDDGANEITFENVGNVAIVTGFTFTPGVGFEAIETAFTSGDADASGMEIAGESDPVIVTVQPAGLLPFNQTGQLTLGTITISLTEGGNS